MKLDAARDDAARLRAYGMPEGFTAQCSVPAGAPIVPVGAPLPKPGAVIVEVFRDGRFVGGRTVDIERGNDGRWIADAVELAVDIDAHEFELHVGGE
jgi:hypothetical protein